MTTWETKEQALAEYDALSAQIDELYWEQDALIHYTNTGRIGDKKMDETERQQQIQDLESRMSDLLARKKRVMSEIDQQFPFYQH